MTSVIQPMANILQLVHLPMAVPPQLANLAKRSSHLRKVTGQLTPHRCLLVPARLHMPRVSTKIPDRDLQIGPSAFRGLSPRIGKSQTLLEHISIMLSLLQDPTVNLIQTAGQNAKDRIDGDLGGLLQKLQQLEKPPALGCGDSSPW